MAMPVDANTRRSGFVTGLAWIFIALSGFATLIAVLQNIMVALIFPMDEMRDAVREAGGAASIPVLARFMLENFQLVFASFLVICVTTLVSAIGLLMRKNWARLLFIAILALGILWNAAGVVLPYFIFSSMPPMADNTPPDFAANFDLMWKLITVITTIVALAFAGLFGWLIRKLVSAEIRREFLAP